MGKGHLPYATLTSTFATLNGDRLSIDGAPLGPATVGAQPAGDYMPDHPTGAAGLAALAANLPEEARDALGITVDTSVGTRVFVGDVMIYGDTGWRSLVRWDAQGNITNGALDEWLQGFGPFSSSSQAGGLLTRRFNGRVSYRLAGARALETGQWLISLPSGFRPTGVDYTPYLVAFHYPRGPIPAQIGQSYIYLFDVPANASTTSTYAATIEFSTSADWPTSLPGTPV